MTAPATTRATRPRLVYLDVLNICAIPLVIFLHVRVAYWNADGSPGWWFENVVSGLGVIAVPIFFMNSGVTLVGFIERSTVGTFYLKRFKKVVVPYLIWSQLYLLFGVLIGARTDVGVGTVLSTVVDGSSAGATLWYLEAAIGVYIVLPVVSLAVLALTRDPERRDRRLLLLLGISVLAAIVLPAVRRILPATLPSMEIPFGGYLVFVLAGYVLSTVTLSALWRRVLYVLGALGVVGFVVAGGELLHRGSPLAPIFTDYLTLGTLCTAAAVFVAVRQARPERLPERARRMISSLAGMTFGIYLVHLMVIETADLWLAPRTPSSDVPMTIGVWAVSLAIVAVLRLIPPVRRWVLP